MEHIIEVLEREIETIKMLCKFAKKKVDISKPELKYRDH